MGKRGRAKHRRYLKGREMQDHPAFGTWCDWEAELFRRKYGRMPNWRELWHP